MGRGFGRICRGIKRCLCLVLCLGLVFAPAGGVAQAGWVEGLPRPGVMLADSAAYAPVNLMGLTLDPAQPLRFDFLIDAGDTGYNAQQIEPDAYRLIRYFLAAMTIPEDDLWVNLSPAESDRVIDPALGDTDLGRDMLAQDYVLKQFAASLFYPKSDLGRSFWDRVLGQAQQKHGITQIPAEALSKIWIVPGRAEIYEDGHSVYVAGARLRVMMENDDPAGPNAAGDGPGEINPSLIRQIIIPAIEHEVNTGENFAPLRQIFHALILAKWYKQTIRDSLFNQVYIDQQKVAGVDLADKTLSEQIYQRYIEALKTGVFNFVNEEHHPQTHELTPRKYFSGGEKWAIDLARVPRRPASSAVPAGQTFRVRSSAVPDFSVPAGVGSSPVGIFERAGAAALSVIAAGGISLAVDQVVIQTSAQAETATVSLIWDHPFYGVDGFHVYMRKKGEAYGTPVWTGRGTQEGISVTASFPADMDPYNLYYFTVTAFAGDFQTSHSNEAAKWFTGQDTLPPVEIEGNFTYNGDTSMLMYNDSQTDWVTWVPQVLTNALWLLGPSTGWQDPLGAIPAYANQVFVAPDPMDPLLLTFRSLGFEPTGQHVGTTKGTRILLTKYYHGAQISDLPAGDYQVIMRDHPDFEVRTADAGGLRLDGIDDFIDAGNLFPEPQEALTLEGTFKVKAFNRGTSSISTAFFSNFNRWQPGGQQGYMVRAYYSAPTQTIRWSFIIADGTGYKDIGSVAMPYDDFQAKYADKDLHIIATFDAGNVMSLSINNETVAQTTSGVPLQMMPDPASSDWIGRTGVNAGFLNGTVGKARVYDHALGDEEAFELFTGGHISEGLRAYYELDEGEWSIAYDDSGLGHDADLFGGPQWLRPVADGTGLVLNGTTDYLETDNIFTSEETALTIEGTVKVKAFNKGTNSISTPFISKWNVWRPDAQKGYMVRAYYSESTDTIRWSFIIADGVGYKDIGSAAMSYDAFQAKYAGRDLHFVAKFQGGSRMSLSIDNEIVAQTTSGVPARMMPDIGVPDWIGRTGINAGFLDGTVTKIRVYDTALDDDQTKALYMGGHISDTLITDYRLDEGRGTVAQDGSGFGHEAELKGTPRWVRPVLDGTRLAFNGTADYLEAGHLFTAPSDAFSMAALVNVKAFNRGESDKSTPFVSNWNRWRPGAQRGYLVRAYYSASTETIRWSFIIADGEGYKDIGSVGIPFDEFQAKYAGQDLLITAGFEGGTRMRLTINNEVVAESTSGVPLQMVPDAESSDWVGRTGINAGYLNGTISNVRVYDTALSPEQEFELFMGGHISAGLRAYYRFDEAQGTIVWDYSDQGHDAQMMGDPEWMVPGHLWARVKNRINGREFVIANALVPEELNRARGAKALAAYQAQLMAQMNAARTLLAQTPRQVDVRGANGQVTRVANPIYTINDQLLRDLLMRLSSGAVKQYRLALPAKRPGAEAPSSPVRAGADPVGGIDMADIVVDRAGTPLDVQFDAQQIQMLMQLPISGFSPIIVNITPVPAQ